MKYGTLRILRTTEMHDFKKSGYFGNLITGNPIAPDGTLIPFFREVAGIAVSSINAFSLLEIDGKDNTLNTYSLSVSYIDVVNLSSTSVFYYDGRTDILATLSSYNDGIYKYYIKDQNDLEYYSAPFEINDFKSIEVIGAGDFSLEDFNDDYYL